MAAYYNEIDEYAAQWLRNLIAAGHIAPGDVDTRSIVDVRPADLTGYTQCHFFAGIGGWSYAARLAGWPDDRPIWTGSCPCQPFSVAGKGEAQADARHLWPEFFRLIAACRPAVVMGEQVAAAVGKHWLDGVHSDLEGIGYACRAAVVPACAVDAPHRRDRLWFVADRTGERPPYRDVCPIQGAAEPERQAFQPERRCCGPVADADCAGIRDQPGRVSRQDGASSRLNSNHQPGDVADADFVGESEGRQQRNGQFGGAGSDQDYRDVEHTASVGRGEGRPKSEFRGRWSAPASTSVSFLAGADGKARRVEPGIRLLAHGVPARVGKLRAYGNAIVPQLAAEVIGAYLDTCEGA